MEEYKTTTEELLENLEKARFNQEDYLLDCNEIQYLLSHIEFLETYCKEASNRICELDYENRKMQKELMGGN